MNWFQRHLNWIVVLSFGVYCLIILLIITLSPGLEPLFTSVRDTLYLFGIWAVGTSVPIVLTAKEYAYFISYFLVPMTLFFVACGWVLHRKGKSLWWLLLLVSVPLSWVVLFFLKDHRVAQVE